MLDFDLSKTFLFRRLPGKGDVADGPGAVGPYGGHKGDGRGPGPSPKWGLSWGSI